MMHTHKSAGVFGSPNFLGAWNQHLGPETSHFHQPPRALLKSLLSIPPSHCSPSLFLQRVGGWESWVKAPALEAACLG